jgi:DNA polymerase III alpha subunit (gram-positive type)
LDFCKHEIIQIAAIHPVSGDSIDIKVQFDISKASPEALAVNGYSEARWANAVTPKQAAIDFDKFCSNHVSVAKKAKMTGKPYRIAVLMGYNNSSFDKVFIDKLMKEHISFSHFDYRQIDVYELAKWLLPYLPEYNLSAMVKYFNMEQRPAHDAFHDVRMTRDVAACLMEILAESKTYEMPQWAKKILDEDDAINDMPF